MNSQRKGDWMQTWSGIRFYPLDPRPEDILIEDIAHALAHICRFGGHVCAFYSVAQHSIMVSDALPDELALDGLLHDATEAYLGDVVRPLKLSLPQYVEAEQKLEAMIAEKFGLKFPMHEAVKDVDNRALFAERRDLFKIHRDWGWSVEPLPRLILPWSPEEAEREFLGAFTALTCDHEWETIDGSFSHAFGTESIVYERCKLCGKERSHEPPTDE
ncbi:phosphohydrolase [Ruficoccus amylovorans]|uniref:Phosphohydrolase n=1 Tax=Ruficoccus amylovorans TaxID=1804625 RepID=A0A842HFT5_9BACT|nr:phosphohydrolase [Ruficoccus amylovorans]MBC2594898.1 phosphohydrolase [Ruficoccus amylovorans]